ncbi:LPS export ABC transporter periplasmic protein LptC [Tenacibaculum dicentrarchi]|uniref:LPS export ABC transporter periplasmic protein LptC n=1 Tax=Tenacibaculum dicentrarchi TaxID=669041 RepID=UPI001BEA710F|nr:LPS export ABC transporter periplasmic protein LptC [Tenacibaculum dicentrarchi]MCD8448348.1 LPS export ABC transporter periplasmic protein LptC [Tenacibaculum dicentrarchi]MDB0614630.1 LPS export ABC transporter periplasmic protein LptC [Tenacibaculum dicentrarchi]
MKQNITNKCKSIVAIFMVTMLFSCVNSKKEVRDFLADKNMPVGTAKNMYHVKKDSGKITSKTKAAIFHDFSNRKDHPYTEFPKGIKIVSIDKTQRDSTSISGNYAITYTKTAISEIKGNVVILNYKENTKLETNQLFWDQKEHYFFTEDGFRLTTLNDTINGFGFESKENLTKWIAKDITGNLQANQK